MPATLKRLAERVWKKSLFLRTAQNFVMDLDIRNAGVRVTNVTEWSSRFVKVSILIDF